MITDLKPYPRMKGSGVAWLGQLPEHWEVSALRHRYDQELGKMLDSKRITGAYPVPYLRNADVQWNRVNVQDLPVMDVSPSEHARYTLRRGDLLVCEGGEVGRCALWRGGVDPCAFQKALHRLRPRDHARDSSRFMLYMLHAAANAQAFTDGHLSTIPHLTGDKLRAHRFAFPDAVEQRSIVRFLDHADRRIRRYIHAKQKLIKLLEEQKQAIIHRAVTRGLDPNVRFKPSNVRWLGDVPEHWEVWQVGHFAAIGNGSTPSRSNVAYWAGGTYPWLNSGSVKAGTILASDQFVTDIALRECHLPRVPAGSVLVAITGQGKTRGTAAVLAIEATINQHIAYITPRKAANTATPEYLGAFFVAAYPELRRMSNDSGSTKGALTCAELRHFRVVLPPLDEQHRIVQWSQDATAEVDAASRLASREISLLREYRTRLIADVVTGKLDVREAEKRLPEEVEETEDVEVVEEVEASAAEDGEEPMEIAERAER